MRKCFLFFILFFCLNSIRAQQDSFHNGTLIINENVDYAKIKTASDGNTWIAFYKKNYNDFYELYVQLVSANSGKKLFGKNGFLLSDKFSGSEMRMFDISIDNENNLILASTYEKANIFNCIVLKVNESGSLVWSKEITQNDIKSSPKILITSANNIVLSWASSNNIVYQKVRSDGNIEWDTPKTLFTTVTNYNDFSCTGLYNSNEESFFILYQQRDKQNFASYLYEQKISLDGKPLWKMPVKASNLLLNFGIDFDAVVDNDTTYIGLSGILPRSKKSSAMLQKISPEGNLLWDPNGISFANPTLLDGANQQDIHIAKQPGKDTLWAVCNFVIVSSINNYVQKLNSVSGLKYFGDEGKPLKKFQGKSSSLGFYNNAPTFMFNENNNLFTAIRLDANGEHEWKGLSRYVGERGKKIYNGEVGGFYKNDMIVLWLQPNGNSFKCFTQALDLRVDPNDTNTFKYLRQEDSSVKRFAKEKKLDSSSIKNCVWFKRDNIISSFPYEPIGINTSGKSNVSITKEKENYYDGRILGTWLQDDLKRAFRFTRTDKKDAAYEMRTYNFDSATQTFNQTDDIYLNLTNIDTSFFIESKLSQWDGSVREGVSYYNVSKYHLQNDSILIINAIIALNGQQKFLDKSSDEYKAILKANINNPNFFYNSYKLKRISEKMEFPISYTYSSNTMLGILGGVLLIDVLSFLTNTDNYMKINFDAYGGSRPIEGYDKYGNTIYQGQGGIGGDVYYDKYYKPIK